MDRGLYVHIPFCVRKCLYCDFVSGLLNGAGALFVSALKKEIALTPEGGGDTFTSVFFGGGTPTVLGADALAEILGALREKFTIAPDAEITTELNPGTLKEGGAETLYRAGFNRVSMGLQSAHDEELKTLGRIHTRRDFETALARLQGAGFTNINADVMHAIPGQTEESYLDTLRFVTGLGLTHISSYALILEEGTPFYGMVSRGELTLPGEDEAAAMEDAGMAFLGAQGYQRYEISNFAREGFRCRHNLTYWDNLPYLGFGPAAHSSYISTRWHNTESTEAYLGSLEKGVLPREEITRVSPREEEFETVMLGLRKTDGVDETLYKARFGRTVPEAFPKAAAYVKDHGLLKEDSPSRYALNARGLDLDNTVLTEFLAESEG